MMQMQILDTTYTVDTLADARDLWNATRDRLDFGASTQAGADVTQDGATVARVSYNGRLWDITGAEICAC